MRPLFYGEHTHIPTSRQTPFPLGGELPMYYAQFFDPFIALTAAAAVTETLKVGTSVCLVPEHHPINLAKATACLDRVSNGRFLFGIGAGWNAEEMANHGVAFKDRWKITRERVLAVREIWTKEAAEFHGQFVDFDPIWCWPKPVQTGGPPILMGATSKWSARRVAEYCDGWFPVDGPYDLSAGVEAIRVEADKAGRSMDEFDLSVITADGGVWPQRAGKSRPRAESDGLQPGVVPDRTGRAGRPVAGPGALCRPDPPVSVEPVGAGCQEPGISRLRSS